MPISSCFLEVNCGSISDEMLEQASLELTADGMLRCTYSGQSLRRAISMRLAIHSACFGVIYDVVVRSRQQLRGLPVPRRRRGGCDFKSIFRSIFHLKWSLFRSVLHVKWSPFRSIFHLKWSCWSRRRRAIPHSASHSTSNLTI